MTNREKKTKLMQFLLQLNDDFDIVRGQIISMDPLPNVNRAFYLVQQKHIASHQIEPTAFYANQPVGNSNNNYRNKKLKDNNDRWFCKHCKGERDTYDQCYERIGYPDWFKGKRKGSQPSKIVAQAGTNSDILDNPLDLESVYEGTGFGQNMMATFWDKVFKMMQNKSSIATPDCGSSRLGDSVVNYVGSFLFFASTCYDLFKP